MAVSISSLAQNFAARATTAETSAFKPGQMLEAVVLGKTPDGLTALKIGDLVINAQLPQTLPPGTTLNLQVKIAGPVPQLALVNAPVLPAQFAMTPPPALPLPAAPPSVQISPVVPQASTPTTPAPAPAPAPIQAASAAPAASAPASIAALQSSIAPTIVPSARSVVAQQPQPQASSPPQPTPAPTAPIVSEGRAAPASAPASNTPLPSTSPAIAPEAKTESQQPLAPISARADSTPPVRATTSAPAQSTAPLVTPTASVPTAASPTEPAPQQAAQSTASVTPTPTATVLSPAQAIPAPPQPSAAPAPSQPNVVAQAAQQPVTPAAPPQPAVAPSAILAPQIAQPTASPTVPLATVPQTLATPPAAPATPPAAPATPTAQLSTSAPAVQAATLAPPTAIAPAPSAPAPIATSTAPPPASEEPSATPLLVVQGAARPQVTVADLPKTLPQLARATTATNAPPPQPTTPQAALAQLLPEAMAKQNSIAPLLQSLATMAARPGILPEPVMRAAMQVLAQRIAVTGGTIRPELLEAAVAKSGIYLEAGLATAARPTADMKAGLNALKGVLSAWLGGDPGSVAPTKQAPPPIRGIPPRAELLEQPPLPDTPREAARALHSQADSAISRIKLMQLASLPDADPSRATQPTEHRMELPFLIGNELVMAQLQISRDTKRQKSDGKRGWTMRFAMNFFGTGEVGAEVGILGKAVNVALWAAEPDTAERLAAMLPELGQSLTALGLDPGGVRVRGAPPEAPKPASGHLLDSLS